MRKILLFVILLHATHLLYSQCGSLTPVFTIDLSSDPNGIWTSPSIERVDTCCGAQQNCVQFIVTLHPDAEGVIFDVIDGALPGGALFYQIDCGGPTSLGQSICLSGVGPHSITFCKPGGNENVYAITSIAEPMAGPDVSLTEGCTQQLTSIGFEPSTILWRSIYPGVIGDYNYLLDCTLQCDTVTVSSEANLPPYIDYQICGFALGLCESIGICDTVRVFFNDSLSVAIEPESPMVCFGDAVTNISAVPVGGVGPYYYTWSTGETTQSIDVGVGTYSVTVSDSGGCYNQFSEVDVGEFLQVITADAGPDQLLCDQNPQAQLAGSVFGVTTGVWKGGSGLFIPDRNEFNAQYTPSMDEINAGYIDLMLLTTNTAGCLPDSDYVRISFTGFMGDITTLNDSVSCFGLSDGSSEVTISGGYQNYSYLWNDPSSSTTNEASNLSTGPYSVLITDSLGCDTSITILIEEPDEIEIFAINSSDVSCFGDSTGQATIYVSGGNGGYTYNWGAEANFQTGQTAIQLAANNYYPFVEDSKGCFADTMLSILQPDELVLFLDTMQTIACFGDSTGEITVDATGGTAPYLFAWNDAANLQVGPTASDLSAGIYSVIVIDSFTCEDTLSLTLSEPSQLTLQTITLQNILCYGDNNGMAAAIVSGGVIPYSFQWDSNANDQSTSLASNLPGGVFYVQVSDSNNCVISDQVLIEQPDTALTLIGSSTDVDCFGNGSGSAAVSVSGGTAPYSYLWSANANSQTTPNIEDLTPGNYTVLVTDSNACTDSISFIINEPSSLIITATSSDVICHGDSNGIASLIVTGGSFPYTYQWNDPAMQTQSLASGLAVGSYTYWVIDDNLCSDSGEVQINEPDPIILAASNDQETCVGDVIEISAQASGGVGTLTYYWNEGLGVGQTQSITVVESTVYEVQAIDSLACSSNSDSVYISVRNIYLDSLNVFNAGNICAGETTSIEAAFIGQDSIYTYAWSNNLGSSFGPLQVSPTDSTWYSFTVTDQCDNSIVDSTLVAVYPIPSIDISLSAGEGCSPLTVDFTNNSNQLGLNYIWLFGDGGASIEPEPSYTYENEGQFLVELQVFSNFGCNASSSNTNFVKVLAAPDANFSASPQITDISAPEISFTNNSSSDALFFTWSFGDGDSIMIENPTHTYTDVGEFEVLLEAENIDGCISSVSRTIIINPTHDVIVPNAFTPNPNGGADGYYDPSDLSNDIFYPFASYVGDFSMLIFNRWGELIFESNDINYGWDGYYKGERSQTGTYVYKIEITFIDGYNETVQGQVKIIN
jgi:gliding motility-associated-like protein